MFREVNYVVEDRSFFCEWALIEANLGNKATSICLSAIALSDGVEKSRLIIRNAHINLYSIALTFLELYRLYENESYFSAMASALRLNERIGKQGKQGEHKQPVMSEQESIKLGAFKEEGKKLEQCLRKGILTAEENREIDFWEGTPKVETLEYKRLFMLGGIIA